MLIAANQFNLYKDVAGKWRALVQVNDDGTNPIGSAGATEVIFDTFPSDVQMIAAAQSWCDAQNAANLAAQQVQ